MKNQKTFESLARIEIGYDDTVTLKATLRTENASVRGITHLGDWCVPTDTAIRRIRQDGFWSIWLDCVKTEGNNIEQTNILNEDSALAFMCCDTFPVLSCDNLQSASLLEHLKPGEYIFGILTMPEGIAVNVHLHEILERLFRRQRLLEKVQSKFAFFEEKYPSRLINYESDDMKELLTRMERDVAKLRIAEPYRNEESALDRVLEKFHPEVNGYHLFEILHKGDCVSLTIEPHVAGRGLPFKVDGVIIEHRDIAVSVKHPDRYMSPTWVQLRFVKEVKFKERHELLA